MEIQHLMVFYLLVLMTYLLPCTQGNRSNFPTGFIFGAGSSAYQYEGAANEDGKGPSMWDTFTRIHPEEIWDHSTADIAEDFYHHYREDIATMKEIGLDSFRFSISWSRVLPFGKISGGVNQEGVKFYNNLINELLSNGIQPFVTLLHFDPPQALEDEYGGCLSLNIVNDYLDYVDFCFKEFGDQVKYWVTMNEPNTFTSDGYATGDGPPARCSNYVGNCAAGNSGTEPYVVIHHLLLSHAAAVKLYREKYQESQKGKIGITVGTVWIVPKFQTTACRKAASRALDFKFGWIVHPVTYGDYPQTMQYTVGDRLPKFTKAQSKMLRGSIDFLGVNYYTANYAEDSSTSSNVNLSYTTDSHVTLTTEKNGVPIGQPTTLSWFFVYPKGIQELMLYIQRKYNNPPIYISENGYGENSSLPVQDAIRDSLRITYFQLHLSHLLKAIKDGVDVKGYYAWSFLDDFEWQTGYTIRFGLTYVDFKNGLKRYWKHSAFWLQKFLQQGNVTATPLLYSE